MIKTIKGLGIILVESVKGYFRDRCFLHASSLTFYTLLSIVPILAVAFGFAKGFGFEENLEVELHKRFQEQKEVVDYVVEFARSMLAQVEGGLVAGIGAILLFLFVLSLFWTIESSMNAIWKVKRSRSILRMLTDYTAMMIICPFFFVIASSLTVFLTTQVDIALEQHDVLRQITPFSFLFYRGITLFMIWILFSCLYIIMPNTRVRVKYGVVAGIIAGTIYYFLQIAILQFQIGVSQYNAIYGSFAALPLFLFWLQFSWTLVLFGAELAYQAEQIVPTLGPAKSRMEMNRTELALFLVFRLIERFHNKMPPLRVSALAEEFGVPTSCIREILSDLALSGILARVRSDKSRDCFQPGQEIRNITLQSVIHAIDKNFLEKISVNVDDDAKVIKKVFKEFVGKGSADPSNISLYSLLDHD